MLVTLNDILKDAEKQKYAVGLFNTINMEMARGVIAAAEELRSPVIIGTAEVLLKFTPLEELASLLLPMAKKASVPVVLHFDHGMTKEKVIECIKLGFSSVMYDCSVDPFEENVRKVAEMTEIAHSFGVSIEAELGHVGANAGADEATGTSIYTDPQEAKRYVEQTGVDALAVAIGTAHGVYKEKPSLDISRLKDIAEVVDVPLVLHGGSGLSNEDFRECVRGGIAKINIFTDVNCAVSRSIARNYQEGKGMSLLINDAVEDVKKEAVEKMLIFGSANKA